MDIEEIKRKLFGLWEKTTHNSKELLSVLFDYYFDSDFIEYEETEGRIISALCGIPYKFGFGKNKLKGLYIIPLTSEEGFKKKGVLADLILKFNEKHKKNFDFTFLVPSTELLADFFHTKGYHNSFYILEERYTPLHDFKNDYLLTLNDSSEKIRDLKKNLLYQILVVEESAIIEENSYSKVIDFIENIEKKGASSVNLCHTRKNLEYLFHKNTIRNLNHFIALDTDGNITGVAFTQKEELKKIRVVAYYVSDISDYYALLNYIKQRFPDHSISVNNSDLHHNTFSLIEQTYASANKSGGDLDTEISTIEVPFNINRLLQATGMVKILNFENILQYIAENRSDIDIKLFIRDLKEIGEDNSREGQNEEKQIVFRLHNGNFEKILMNNPTGDKNILNLSKKELTELLFRKTDSSNLIMEAFGIPRLDLQIKLLPC